MGVEIERKFLVSGDGWKGGASSSEEISQGFLSLDPARVVRVRLAGDRGFLTVKGKAEGIRRAEFEYAIPAEDARGLLAMCTGAIITKTRHLVGYGGHTWEVDEFGGENAGLVVAEVELGDEGESVELPPWAGEEVSDDPRYTNVMLAVEAFGKWGKG